jgi:hypothetical protein
MHSLALLPAAYNSPEDVFIYIFGYTEKTGKIIMTSGEREKVCHSAKPWRRDSFSRLPKKGRRALEGASDGKKIAAVKCR